ncbi:GGDEF domain-containing protein [Couchioplanes caeruleus]|uniref:Diguanylate cyclase (GGDEF)-like protein n=1 Tax=Couchioplanes caeruleus TaxID=56438 RepID=A0A3N1GTW0_9ACTN|nr:diguanylate cyclase [Couchioplanes caeruleus]ROP33700.1 diguanylate cyclase (GGDEF)-like protein [Couchioplanes caeruleus]
MRAHVAEEPSVDTLVDLSVTAPQAAARLDAALRTMETIAPARYREIAEPAVRAERLAAELDRPDLVIRARLAQADALAVDGDMAAAGRIAHEALAWSTEHGGAYLVARSHRQLALFFYHVGDAGEALGNAVQCVAHTGEDAPPQVRARHLSMLAVMLDVNGSQAEARRRFTEALDVAGTLDDPQLSLQILNNLAYTEYSYGHLGRAQELVERMRAYGIRLAATELDTIARVELSRGRYAEAEATLRPVLEGARDDLLDEGKALAECLLTAAEAQRLRGAVAAAQATLDRAARFCDERQLAAARARVREEQARLYAATDRYREAYEEYQRFHSETQALQSAEREARARALQVVFEIEEARRESVRFRELALRDALTGLHNRRFVDDRLGEVLVRAAADRLPVSAALVDLDHFKRINDTLAHAAGDAVLQEVARLLTAAAAEDDVVARLGGEEFVLVLPGIDTDEAVRRCERLRRSIAQHAWRPITGDLPVTASIGVTTVADGGSTPSALLAAADRNLYAAKRSGRNRVVADPA